MALGRFAVDCEQRVEGIYDYQGRSEADTLKKCDELCLKMIDYLTEIGAFEQV